MPYILLKMFPNPSQLPNKQTIHLNYGANGFSRVAIHSYQVTGLQVLGPLFIQFRNQPTTPVIGNGNSTEFPLLIGSAPDFAYEYKNPLVIAEGDNAWNDAKTLEVEVRDFQGDLALYTGLYVLLEYLEKDRHNPEPYKPDQVVHYKEATQFVTPNRIPFPNGVYAPHKIPSSAIYPFAP